MRAAFAGALAVGSLSLAAAAAATSPSDEPGAPTVTAAVGTIKEFKIPSTDSNPRDIAVAPDGNLWFTEGGSVKIGRITPSGAITEFAIPTTAFGPEDVVAGPDANLWFTDDQARKIGRLTTAGAIVEFAVPSGGQPIGITAGADGNLWFTEGSNMIGRITPAGVITEFGPSGGDPSGIGTIAPGPDGNVWFTENFSNKVGRITPTGLITEFTLPAGTQPNGISPGPDGNIWFTEQTGNRIDRITPSGTITAFDIPTPSSGPLGIAPGPDGNLWFGEAYGGHIGRVTPSGTITEFPLPAGSNAFGLALGSDGNVWFVDNNANSIGRVRTTEPETSYVLSLDGGFAPVRRTTKLGSRVQWTFLGPANHSVGDSSGMGLFDSDVHSIVSFFSFTFTSAGRYRYEDTLHSTLAGSIKVLPTVTPRSGTTATVFTVTWASAPPPAGFVEDIQLKRPGATSYSEWQTGQTTTSGIFVADAGPGTYSFRGRLRKTADNTHANYASARPIAVSD